MVKIYFSHDGVCIFFRTYKNGAFQKKMARDEISNIKERETETVQIWGISKKYAYAWDIMPSPEKYIFQMLFWAFHIAPYNKTSIVTVKSECSFPTSYIQRKISTILQTTQVERFHWNPPKATNGL